MYLMNFCFADATSPELSLALVRVEPVLLGSQQFVFVDFAAATFSDVASSGLPRIWYDNL